MSDVLALAVIETSRRCDCRGPRPLPGADVAECMNENCTHWEAGRNAYTWRDGDPVYLGGAA